MEGHPGVPTWCPTFDLHLPRIAQCRADLVHQLRAVGKAGDEILLPAYVIWPVYVALMVVWFSWCYFRRLLPKKRQLEALAQSYEGS
jgi:hypothetical protein